MGFLAGRRALASRAASPAGRALNEPGSARGGAQHKVFTSAARVAYGGTWRRGRSMDARDGAFNDLISDRLARPDRQHQRFVWRRKFVATKGALARRPGALRGRSGPCGKSARKTCVSLGRQSAGRARASVARRRASTDETQYARLAASLVSHLAGAPAAHAPYCSRAKIRSGESCARSQGTYINNRFGHSGSSVRSGRQSVVGSGLLRFKFCISSSTQP